MESNDKRIQILKLIKEFLHLYKDIILEGNVENFLDKFLAILYKYFDFNIDTNKEYKKVYLYHLA